ncbi:hypothetical protein Tco_0450845 [Tanacetum coccineum]
MEISEKSSMNFKAKGRPFSRILLVYPRWIDCCLAVELHGGNLVDLIWFCHRGGRVTGISLVKMLRLLARRIYWMLSRNYCYDSPDYYDNDGYHRRNHNFGSTVFYGSGSWKLEISSSRSRALPYLSIQKYRRYSEWKRSYSP